MTSPWRPGERAVQDRMGMTAAADELASMIGGELPDPARRFVARQPWLLVATRLDDGTAWPSVLSGAPGFLGAGEADRLDIAARPAEGDPLSSALTDGRPVGSLLLEPRRRRRMRANGRFSVGDGRMAIRTTQVLSNCTRFIQKRSLDPAWVQGVPRLVSDEPTLSDRQRRWIDRADTAFIATTDIDGEADMSHRGGRPGWITVTDGRVAYDERPGNAMYLTLGNLERTRSAGLLFVDFDTGGTLHVAGECQATYPLSGQPRLSVTPIRVVELAGAAPAPWSPPEFSPDL